MPNYHNVSISLVKQSHQDNLPRVQCSRFCLTEPVKGCFCHKMALLSSKYRVNIYLLKTRQLPGNALVILSFTDIFSTQPFSAKVHTYYYAIKTYCSLKWSGLGRDAICQVWQSIEGVYLWQSPNQRLAYKLVDRWGFLLASARKAILQESHVARSSCCCGDMFALPAVITCFAAVFCVWSNFWKSFYYFFWDLDFFAWSYIS